MEKGFTPDELTKQQLLSDMNEEELKFQIITSLSTKEKVEYEDLLKELKSLHRKNSQANTAEKGEILEKVVTFLFEKSSVFEVLERIHTSTNEIDQLITLNSRGREFKLKGYIDLKDDIILSECKNYEEKVGVTWVGKFASLLGTSNVKLGLLFSYHGLTGKGWNDAVGLTKKVYLSKPKDEKIFILDFNKYDFESIKNGRNLLSLIKAKTLAIQLDTKFDHFITKHPAEK
ncbi:acetylglutamate semialdehyde dehydrogenase [Schinkia sp. CFF1]